MGDKRRPVGKKKASQEAREEKSFPITLGFGPNANSSMVDVKNGKIVRIRPLHYDWNPDGDRNVENRGKSEYVRISWDEALELIAKEIKRIKKEYGPYAILCQQDGHAEVKTVHCAHVCAVKIR
jgi:hypothetical protein